MILLDVIVVALSNIPLGSFYIYAVTKGATVAFTPTESLLYILTPLVSTIQASGSFYLYMIASSAFRSNVKNMLRDILCFWKSRVAPRIAPSVVADAAAIKVPTVVV